MAVALVVPAVMEPHMDTLVAGEGLVVILAVAVSVLPLEILEARVLVELPVVAAQEASAVARPAVDRAAAWEF
jgi:hypothetical protein